MDAIVKESVHNCEEMKVALATIETPAPSVPSSCVGVLHASLRVIFMTNRWDTWERKPFLSKTMGVFRLNSFSLSFDFMLTLTISRNLRISLLVSCLWIAFMCLRLLLVVCL